MDKTLTINTQQQNGQFILQLSGRLDTLGSRELDEALRQLPEQEHPHILLDMQGVVFLSSAGIRILIKYYKQSRENQGDFSLGNVPAQATGVLKMVGLEQLILSDGQQPQSNTPKEYVYDNIKFQCQLLHQEPAELIKYDNSNTEPSELRPYDALIGRNQDNQEFMVIGKLYISNSGLTDSWAPFPQYYIGTHGAPSHFISFAPADGKSVPLSSLLAHLLSICEAGYAGIQIIASTGGIVGITQKGPQPLLTGQPVYPEDTVLLNGIIHTGRFQEAEPYTRLLQPEGSLSGHLHAAIYPELPGNTRETDLNKQIRQLVNNSCRQHLFHLINDNRIPDGSGETSLKHGCAWLTKIK